MATTISPSEQLLNSTANADYRLLWVALWSVCVYAGLGLLGLAVFTGFWPPPAENLDAAGIAAYFRDHDTGIRIGMVLLVVGAPCYYTWSVALSKIISQCRRCTTAAGSST